MHETVLFLSVVDYFREVGVMLRRPVEYFSYHGLKETYMWSVARLREKRFGEVTRFAVVGVTTNKGDTTHLMIRLDFELLVRQTNVENQLPSISLLLIFKRGRGVTCCG